MSDAGVEEKDAVEPKFLSRSLATLRVLLKNARFATSQKIKAEHEGRRQRNAEASAVFGVNFHMWRHVGGPCWDDLRDPSDEALQRAEDAKAQFIAIRDRQDGADNAGSPWPADVHDDALAPALLSLECGIGHVCCSGGRARRLGFGNHPA